MPHGARPPAAPSRVPRARQNPNMGTAPAQRLARAALWDGCSQDARGMLAARSRGTMLTGCSLHAAAGCSWRAATLGTPRRAGHPCFGAGTNCSPLTLHGPTKALGGPQQRALVVTPQLAHTSPSATANPTPPFARGSPERCPPRGGVRCSPILCSSGQLPCAHRSCRLCRSKHGDTWFLGTSGSPRSLPGQSWPRSRPRGRTLLAPWPLLPGGSAPAPASAAPAPSSPAGGRGVPQGQSLQGRIHVPCWKPRAAQHTEKLQFPDTDTHPPAHNNSPPRPTPAHPRDLLEPLGSRVAPISQTPPRAPPAWPPRIWSCPPQAANATVPHVLPHGWGAPRAPHLPHRPHNPGAVPAGAPHAWRGRRARHGARLLQHPQPQLGAGCPVPRPHSPALGHRSAPPSPPASRPRGPQLQAGSAGTAGLPGQPFRRLRATGRSGEQLFPSKMSAACAGQPAPGCWQLPLPLLPAWCPPWGGWHPRHAPHRCQAQPLPTVGWRG